MAARRRCSGPDYIIPKPFDPRLILQIAPAVARAAMDTGVARRPIADFDAYRRELERFVFRSGQLMRPVFEARQGGTRRGSSMPRARTSACCARCRALVDDDMAAPDPDRPPRRDRAAGARDGPAHGPAARACRCSTPARTRRCSPRWSAEYQRLVARRGVPPDAAARRVRTRPTVAAAMLLHAGRADAAICGGSGDWWRHMQYVMPIIPKRPEVSRIYALSCLILQAGVLFICDTHMNLDPTAEQIAEMTLLAAEAVRGFGLHPKAALLSHSSFGASNSPSARKMRQALALIRERAPELEIDGEMHADAALAEAIRHRAGAGSAADRRGQPAGHARAGCRQHRLQPAEGGRPRGCRSGRCCWAWRKPVHVVPPSVTARGILNVSAIAALEAQALRRGAGLSRWCFFCSACSRCWC